MFVRFVTQTVKYNRRRKSRPIFALLHSRLVVKVQN